MKPSYRTVAPHTPRFRFIEQISLILLVLGHVNTLSIILFHMEKRFVGFKKY